MEKVSEVGSVVLRKFFESRFSWKYFGKVFKISRLSKKKHTYSSLMTSITVNRNSFTEIDTASLIKESEADNLIQQGNAFMGYNLTLYVAAIC